MGGGCDDWNSLSPLSLIPSLPPYHSHWSVLLFQPLHRDSVWCMWKWISIHLICSKIHFWRLQLRFFRCILSLFLSYLLSLPNLPSPPSLHTSLSSYLVTHITHSDPSAYSMAKVNRSVSREPAVRMQNLQLLIRNIKHFYLTQLQQLVITGLPNITNIAHSPDSGEYSASYQ